MWKPISPVVRQQVAKMLHVWNTYQQIREKCKVSDPTIAKVSKDMKVATGQPVQKKRNIHNMTKHHKFKDADVEDAKANWFYNAMKDKRPELAQWEGGHERNDPRAHDWRGERSPIYIIDDPAPSDLVKRWDKKLQPYKLLVNKDNEVDVIDEELSALDKILEKLEKRWITIGGIDYQALRQHKSRALDPYLDGDESNVLVIGDIHAPHDLDGYLAFCREQQELWNCWTIIFIGDVADFHSISQRQKIPEILNPKWEIALAIERLKDWYATFPKATVTLGNHDLRPWKAAAGAWLLREFIQDANTIFQAPATYDFVNEIIINNVLYTHWTKGTAFKKCVTEWMNIVQWHCHNSAGVQYYRNRQWQVRWLQTGNWIDYEKVAFDYAKELSAQPVLSCGVVLNNWRLPIVLPFK